MEWGANKKQKKALVGGIVGGVISAVCCFTPILVIGMTAVGLSSFIGWIDYIFLPILLLCLGMVVFALTTYKKSQSTSPLILQTTITCPQCDKKTKTEMPQNACQWFYECVSCGVLLSPKKGDCCVFCSYGEHQCPPKQQGASCCR